MKIIGLDGKEYSSVKECQRADIEFERAQAEAVAKEKAAKQLAEEKAKEAKLATTKRKKELADKIEAADRVVKESLANYESAKERAQKLVLAAKEEASVIISDAKKQLHGATEEKMQCIRDFNIEFGPYTKTLTGDDAWAEYKQYTDIFSPFSLLSKFFDI